MDQTGGFAASSWLVRQVARTGFRRISQDAMSTDGCHLRHDTTVQGLKAVLVVRSNH
jgi:hypothetical protein